MHIVQFGEEGNAGKGWKKRRKMGAYVCSAAKENTGEQSLSTKCTCCNYQKEVWTYVSTDSKITFKNGPVRIQ